MREATVGRTYDTTRGVFTVIGVINLGLMLRRSDRRIVQVALSDWTRWNPVLCPTPPEDHNI
jgi:hypothetical protein